MSRRRIKWRHRLQFAWADFVKRMPWVPNEGEATARVVDMCFEGYPMPEDFADKEDAVNLLQSIWNVVDNWDGSRVNVEWASTGRTGTQHGTVADWARSFPDEFNR